MGFLVAGEVRDVLIGAHSARGRRACGARHDGLGSNGKIRCTMTAEKKRKKRQTKKKKDGPSCAGGIGTSKEEEGKKKKEGRRDGSGGGRSGKDVKKNWVHG